MKKRVEIIEKDLETYGDNRRRVFLAFRDYHVRREDLVPAIAGAIGKVSLVAAFAMAWVSALGITDPTFVVDNVRLEIFIGGILSIIFCTFLSPRSAPPGTLAPLIPLIPIMAAAGVHPIPFALIISVAALVLSAIGGFKVIASLNKSGTKAGLMLQFGILGVTGSAEKLLAWVPEKTGPILSLSLLLGGAIVYYVLARVGLKWLMIPACGVFAIIVSAVFGQYPELSSLPGMPILDPRIWWLEKWGLGYGLRVRDFLAALPFVLPVLAMWPTDAVAVKALQEKHYPERAEKAVMDMDKTFRGVAIRNIIGTILGGAQTAAVWRSFMIPLAVVKRPIAGAALLLGIIGILFSILGFPVDIAAFPPLVWLVLIFGVFLPLVEGGIAHLKHREHIITAIICVGLGMVIHPIIGWCGALVAENFNVVGLVLDRRSKMNTTRISNDAMNSISTNDMKSLSKNEFGSSRRDRILTVVIAVIGVVATIMSA